MIICRDVREVCYSREEGKFDGKKAEVTANRCKGTRTRIASAKQEVWKCGSSIYIEKSQSIRCSDDVSGHDRCVVWEGREWGDAMVVVRDTRESFRTRQRAINSFPNFIKRRK